MVESYEVEFIGRRVGKIAREVAKTDSRIEEFEEWENGFRIKLAGAKRKLLILCRDEGGRRGCPVIVNSSKLPRRGEISINADRIARKYGSGPEIVMLGALAKLGVVDIKTLMSIIYREFGYSHAIAAKRGYEEARI